MKAAFYTLGCKVNQYEAQALARQFREAGFTIAEPPERAEVHVINSCTVTSVGDQKTRQLLRRIRRQNPEAVIALTGCYPQAFPQEAMALKEADIVLGARDRARLLGDVERVLAARRLGSACRVAEVCPHQRGEGFEPMRAEDFAGHTRAFVKIEDGCDQWCAYCIIPKARGPVRSRPLPELREELAGLTARGYREIVLVGINLSSYGKGEGRTLADAAELACAAPDVRRVRLGSLEPELLTESELSRLSRLEPFCPQFHLSLQSGCEATLRRMNRRYTPAEYTALVQRIRAVFPGAAITTDIMVGFPGETEEEFAQSLEFVRELGLARAHVFPYSVREGTRAADMPGQVPAPVKERRAREMAAVTDESRRSFWKAQLGSTQEVLFETLREDGAVVGYTRNYTPVLVPQGQELPGQILPVRLLSAGEDGCAGELAK